MLTNKSLVKRHRIQRSMDGQFRVLVPCFFGLFWKCWKQGFGTWDGIEYSIFIFKTKEEACQMIKKNNEEYWKEVATRTWNDVGSCC